MAAAHAAADAAEDGLFGEGVRGDEVPGDLADPRTRGERIAAALADLKAEREAAAAERDAQAREYLARAEAGQRRRGGTPAGAAVTAARIAARAGCRGAPGAARRAGGQGEPGRAVAGPPPGLAPRRRRGLLPGQGRAQALAKAEARAARPPAPGTAQDQDRAPVRNITDPTRG